jgi:DNA-binding FadR family transcriptional regulator
MAILVLLVYIWFTEVVMTDSVASSFAAGGLRGRARQQSTELQALIERQILEGHLKPGDKIATERDLARQFEASRSVVRNALAELEAAGLIARKVGSGTVVQAPPDAPALPLLDTSPAELMEFRLALEPGLANAIVLNASAREIVDIVESAQAGRDANDLDTWEKCDRAFHVSLVRATHNRLAITVYEAVVGIRHERPWLRAKEGHTDAASWSNYQQQHLDIAEALQRRDAQAATSAMRRHLEAVRANMLQTPPSPNTSD